MDGIETDLHASGAVLPLVIAVVLRPISLLLQLPCSHNTVTGHSSSFVTARGQAAASKQQLVEQTEIPQVKKQLHGSNGSRGSFFFNNCIVPLGFLLWGIQIAFHPGKPAATEWRYLTYSACWVFSSLYNPPNSDMDCRSFNVIAVTGS